MQYGTVGRHRRQTIVMQYGRSIAKMVHSRTFLTNWSPETKNITRVIFNWNGELRKQRISMMM